MLTYKFRLILCFSLVRVPDAAIAAHHNEADAAVGHAERRM